MAPVTQTESFSPYALQHLDLTDCAPFLTFTAGKRIVNAGGRRTSPRVRSLAHLVGLPATECKKRPSSEKDKRTQIHDRVPTLITCFIRATTHCTSIWRSLCVSGHGTAQKRVQTERASEKLARSRVRYHPLMREVRSEYSHHPVVTKVLTRKNGHVNRTCLFTSQTNNIVYS